MCVTGCVVCVYTYIVTSILYDWVYQFSIHFPYDIPGIQNTISTNCLSIVRGYSYLFIIRTISAQSNIAGCIPSTNTKIPSQFEYIVRSIHSACVSQKCPTTFIVGQSIIYNCVTEFIGLRWIETCWCVG